MKTPPLPQDHRPSAPELAAVLGHRTLAMVRRYAHLSDQHTGAVVERMTRKYFR